MHGPFASASFTISLPQGFYTPAMTDPIQHALHSAATQNPLLASLSVFCASGLLFVLVALLALTGLLNLRRLTWRLVGPRGQLAGGGGPSDPAAESRLH